MDKTRLIFDNATEIAGNKEIGILSLTDLDKTRQLSIVCERNVALEIDKRKSPEPETADQKHEQHFRNPHHRHR